MSHDFKMVLQTQIVKLCYIQNHLIVMIVTILAKIAVYQLRKFILIFLFIS